jgi:hypothetical protein
MASVLNNTHYDTEKQSLVEPLASIKVETSSANPNPSLSLWVNSNGPTLMLGSNRVASSNTGDVVGISASIDHSLAKFNGATGKILESSMNARPCAKLSRYVSTGTTLALTGTPVQFSPAGDFSQYSDSVIFDNPAAGRIRYLGLYVGDPTPRTFRIVYNINYAATSTAAITMGYAINPVRMTSTFMQFCNNATGSSNSAVNEDYLDLYPGDYVSLYLSSAASQTLTYYKFSFFIELIV